MGTSTTNMPKTPNDTDGDVEEAGACQKGPMETSTKGRHGQGKWKQEMRDKYTTTWASPDGKTRRQSD